VTDSLDEAKAAFRAGGGVGAYLPFGNHDDLPALGAARETQPKSTPASLCGRIHVGPAASVFMIARCTDPTVRRIMDLAVRAKARRHRAPAIPSCARMRPGLFIFTDDLDGSQHGPNGGVADSLDEAKAASRAAGGASAIARKSRREMLNLSISVDDPGCVPKPDAPAYCGLIASTRPRRRSRAAWQRL
jgi:hypothetical protein